MTDPADYILRCDCGAVVMELRGEPAARAFCHCDACRELYGSMLLAATAWSPAQVTYIGDAEALLDYPHPTRQMRRYTCRRCGELVHGRNRLDMIVVPNARFARLHDGKLPEALKPTLHLFYANRMFDITDDLPKYLQGWDGPLHT
ncbi:GFA family protein [Dyella sp. 20L07]|uniref:GFA family protein n=1 Tax=Dyella sp. 20L07 TaxID=3384240 RepID=UPI003D2BA2CD